MPTIPRKNLTKTSLIFLGCFCLFGLFAAACLLRSGYDRLLTPDHCFEETLKGLSRCPSRHWYEMRLLYQAQEELRPDASILFFGDSFVQRLAVQSVSNRAVNYGIGTETSEELLHRLDDYRLDTASAVALLIGVNDMKHRSDVEILLSYEQILKKLESVPVFCVPVFPIDEPVRSEWLTRSNSRINRFNHQLRLLCEGYGATVVDLPAGIVTAEGNLAAEFHIGDGLHLNGVGNEKLTQSLRIALEGLTIPTIESRPGH